MQQVYVDLFEQKTGVERSEKAVFGIRVIVKTEDGFEHSVVYPDISYSRKKVESFVAMLLRNDVSPVHIDEMIDDFFFAL